MSEGSQLSVNDRVMIHLARFATDIAPEEYPAEITQMGIASAVGISRTHVPRSVKVLEKDGLLVELTARVKGHERRMSVYAVTVEGMRKTEDLWKEVLDTRFPVLTNGMTSLLTGKEIEAMIGRKRASAVISQMRDGVVSIDETRRAPVRELEGAPSVRTFFGRDNELDSMEEFLESVSRTLVVLGNKGYGISSLVRKFVDEQEDQDVLWVQLNPDITVGAIEKKLSDFSKLVGQAPVPAEHVLSMKNLLVVFDDYHSVHDEVVEFFSTIVESKDGAKIVITAREETPAYNWFYHRKEVDSKLVRELRIRGLDEDAAKRLLGNDKIETDALKRIMMISRGQPLTLRLLREGDLEGLKANTVFTAEEIRYMLYLKDKNG
jgi:DNA-binding Lrp family transcriptional regulator